MGNQKKILCPSDEMRSVGLHSVCVCAVPGNVMRSTTSDRMTLRRNGIGRGANVVIFDDCGRRWRVAESTTAATTTTTENIKEYHIIFHSNAHDVYTHAWRKMCALVFRARLMVFDMGR